MSLRSRQDRKGDRGRESHRRRAPGDWTRLLAEARDLLRRCPRNRLQRSSIDRTTTANSEKPASWEILVSNDAACDAAAGRTASVGYGMRSAPSIPSPLCASARCVLCAASSYCCSATSTGQISRDRSPVQMKITSSGWLRRAFGWLRSVRMGPASVRMGRRALGYPRHPVRMGPASVRMGPASARIPPAPRSDVPGTPPGCHPDTLRPYPASPRCSKKTPAANDRAPGTRAPESLTEP